jgi:hypothetical protein
MKTKIKKTSMVEKWEVKYENEYSISTWKYNSKISRINPYEVSIEYKGEPETKKKRSTRKKTG